MSDLEEALTAFVERERRYGGIGRVADGSHGVGVVKDGGPAAPQDS